jgi:hypothetical protein
MTEKRETDRKQKKEVFYLQVLSRSNVNCFSGEKLAFLLSDELIRFVFAVKKILRFTFLLRTIHIFFYENVSLGKKVNNLLYSFSRNPGEDFGRILLVRYELRILTTF